MSVLSFNKMPQHQASTMAKTGYKEKTVGKAGKEIRKKKEFYGTPAPKHLAKAVKNKDKGRLLG